jgi:hypothetical protein
VRRARAARKQRSRARRRSHAAPLAGRRCSAGRGGREAGARRKK